MWGVGGQKSLNEKQDPGWGDLELGIWGHLT